MAQKSQPSKRKRSNARPSEPVELEGLKNLARVINHIHGHGRKLHEVKPSLNKRNLKRKVLGDLTGEIATSAIVLRAHGIRRLCRKHPSVL